jgi:solute carrier family 7 (cationic amino acid transporter), member 3
LISVGALAGLTTTILVSLLSTSRIVYSISRDGLFPRFLSYVSPRTNSTTIADALVGSIAALLAFLFNTENLADISSLGIMLAFISVSFCVFLVRIKHSSVRGDARAVSFIVSLVLASMAGSLVTSLCVRYGAPYYVVLPVSLSFVLPACVLVGYFRCFVELYEYPTKTLQIPLMPVAPILSLIINTYMAAVFPYSVWALYAAFLLCGIVCYFAYGYRFSALNAIDSAADQQHVDPTPFVTDVSRLVIKQQRS